MSVDSLLPIARLLLPEVLVRYFDFIKHELKGEEIHFYFTELNHSPQEHTGSTLHSKGFFPEATVQDVPIRLKNVFLHITRRRWIDTTTSRVVTRDWDLVAKGTKMTSEFATFLKECYQ